MLKRESKKLIQHKKINSIWLIREFGDLLEDYELDLEKINKRKTAIMKREQ